MLTKFLQPTYEKSLNQKFREKRFAFFKELLQTLPQDRTIQILDIGGTESYWNRMKFTENDHIQITLLNLYKFDVTHKNFTSVIGDACCLSEFADGQFDIVFSNSVIEHLFTKENQKQMAEEVRRVGRYYYVQTPNYYFPIEPHWLFPFFQFLPFRVKVAMTKRFNLGNYPKTPDEQMAIQRVNEVKLLTRKEMEELFPDGEVYLEKFLGLTKSITMYHFQHSKLNRPV